MATTQAIESLARSLGRSASSLDALAGLDDQTLALLTQALDRRVETHQEALERGYARVLPWPLRGLVVGLLRRP